MEPNTQPTPEAVIPVSNSTNQPPVTPAAPPVPPVESVPASPSHGVSGFMVFLLMILSLLAGALGTYYGLPYLNATTEQAQTVGEVRTVFVLPEFVAPQEGQTITVGSPYSVRWSPISSQEGQVARMWIGNYPEISEVIQVGKDNDVKLGQGTYALTVDTDMYEALNKSKQGQLIIQVGHYEGTSTTSQKFIVENSFESSPFMLVASSTAK